MDKGFTLSSCEATRW